MTFADSADDRALAALIAAEHRALALLDAIEAAGIIAPGQSESAIERAIFTIAARDFGVTEHWHDRVVRAGANTLLTAGDTAPDRVVAHDDIVFIDLGPVFAGWEGDVGRSYAVGQDPQKHALCADLPRVFEAVRAQFLADPDMTGAGLHAAACDEAAARGWHYGGRIAGHLVGEFPHMRAPGDKTDRIAWPANPGRMRDRDAQGRARHWILEIHLLTPDRSLGAFYERLLLDHPA